MDFILLKSISYLIKIEARYNRESISIKIKLFIIRFYTLSLYTTTKRLRLWGIFSVK